MAADAAAPPPKAERLQAIARLAAGQPPSWFTPFRDGYLKAPVASVPEGLLLYRAENGRLIAELEEYARGHGMGLDELAAREETAEVQSLLHRFLAAKASDPRGPVFQELERLAQQTEPLLITADGVLVNGNRRLAAMRELLARDPARYGGFASVSAAVLPADASPADVETVEAALQLAPETKLAYGWINRRLKLRRQRDELGVPLDAIAAAYRLADPGQLERELGELALAEDYLSSFLGEGGRYSLVADAELLFVGLAARLGRLPDELRPIWRLAGFAMIAGRAAVSGPMERHFPFAEPVPEHMPAWALRRFAEERELVQDGGALQDLSAVFADTGRAHAVARELFELMERLRAEFQEDQSPQRVLKLLEKLHHTLRRMDSERMDPAQRLKLRSQLAAVQAEAEVLLGDGRQPGLVARLLGRR